ncbi:uncharacterized protein SCHCODRAFT_02460237, partial [Schizophyllum commune H4-8]
MKVKISRFARQLFGGGSGSSGQPTTHLPGPPSGLPSSSTPDDLNHALHPTAPSPTRPSSTQSSMVQDVDAGLSVDHEEATDQLTTTDLPTTEPVRQRYPIIEVVEDDEPTTVFGFGEDEWIEGQDDEIPQDESNPVEDGWNWDEARYDPDDEFDFDEVLMRELMDFREELSDHDIALLRHFALKNTTEMTEATFEKLRFAFPKSNVASYKVTRRRAAFLAKFQPVPYDCCVNSCCCYTGPHADKQKCPFCNADRLDANGNPRRRFTYIPLIPRLRTFYGNLGMIDKLRYRHNFTCEPDYVQDVMDGSHYRTLRSQHVSVGGQTFTHKYFDDEHDIALGLSTDGFAPFKRRKKTC